MVSANFGFDAVILLTIILGSGIPPQTCRHSSLPHDRHLGAFIKVGQSISLKTAASQEGALVIGLVTDWPILS